MVQIKNVINLEGYLSEYFFCGRFEYIYLSLLYKKTYEHFQC